MVKKSKTDTQPVTQKEFVETKNEFVKQFKNIDQRFEQVDKRFEQVDQRFEQVDQRFDKIEEVLIRHSKELIKHGEDIEYIKNTMATKDDVQKILTAIDNFAGKTVDYEHKSILNTHRLEIIEPRIEDHEKRISTLETTVLK